MNAIPEIEMEGFDRERKLIGLLDRSRRLQAYDLMPWIGATWHDKSTHQSAFVQFLNVYLRARKILERRGLTINRTGGGTPSDYYWIEPVHAGSPSV